jgi:hypothetical protein
MGVDTERPRPPAWLSQWLAADVSTTQRRIPTWAFVLAIVFVLFFLLGLLFLLVREEVTRGYVRCPSEAGTSTTRPSCQWPALTTAPRFAAWWAHAQALAAQAPAV